MEKVNILNHAAVLAEKHDISKQEAKKFIETLVEIIQEGIDTDKLVKIKGLGTFKIIGVESRESVDVNTGNRVVIDGHDKLTFTPDTAMKELVNRPFSQFETVILNDGVNFEDVTVEEETDDLTGTEIGTIENEEPEQMVTESQIEPEIVNEAAIEPESEEDKLSKTIEESAEESPLNSKADAQDVTVGKVEVEENNEADLHTKQDILANEEESQKEMQPDVNQQVSQVRSSDAESKTVDSVSSQVKLLSEVKEHNVEKKNGNTYLFIFLIVGVAVFSLVAGYFIGQFIGAIPSKEEKPSVEMLVEPEDTHTEDTTTMVKDHVVLTDTVKAEKDINDTISFYKKYEDMDSRVRTGAYYIVGTDQVVKARKGQTLGRISRSILGEGMECYMEVYNGMKATTVLEEGQDILIPKLVVKKRLKK